MSTTTLQWVMANLVKHQDLKKSFIEKSIRLSNEVKGSKRGSTNDALFESGSFRNSLTTPLQTLLYCLEQSFMMQF